MLISILILILINQLQVSIEDKNEKRLYATGVIDVGPIALLCQNDVVPIQIPGNTNANTNTNTNTYSNTYSNTISI